MNWWEWVFSGVGVLGLGSLIEWFRRRSRSSGQEATITAQGARVSDSPVASGSGITQTVNSPTVHFNFPQQQAPPVPVPPPAPPQAPRSDIQQTGARII